MKRFERWKYEEVELTFGTERVKDLPSLVEWLKADEPADDFEKKSWGFTMTNWLEKWTHGMRTS